MNRRSFLRNSSVAALATAASSSLFSPSAEAQTSTVPASLLNAANGGHVTATANTWAGDFSAQDWINLSNAHTAVANNIVSVGTVDPQIKAAAKRVAGLEMSAGYDYTEFVASVRAYQSTFAMQYWTPITAPIPVDAASVATALTYIQEHGLSALSKTMAARFTTLAAYITASEADPGSQVASLQTAEFLRPRRRSLIPAAWHDLPAKPNSREQGGGYSCQADAAANFFVSTALITVAVMIALPEAALVGAAWGAIATYGGIGAGGWAIGHAIGCGF